MSEDKAMSEIAESLHCRMTDSKCNSSQPASCSCGSCNAYRHITTLEQRVAELQAAYELMTSTATSWFDEKEVAEAKVAELEAAQQRVLVRLFNAGYAAGHDDTVEACYIDVADCDKDTYHADDVAEWLKEHTPPAAQGEQ